MAHTSRLSLSGGDCGCILNTITCRLLLKKAFRDQYREIATAGDGMNWHLVERFIEVGVAEERDRGGAVQGVLSIVRLEGVLSIDRERLEFFMVALDLRVVIFLQVQALLLCPVCPHFAEHVWTLLGKASIGTGVGGDVLCMSVGVGVFFMCLCVVCLSLFMCVGMYVYVHFCV